VVTKDQELVFRPDEIDEDGEVPAPFCYFKSKKALGMGANEAANMFGENAL